MAITFATRFNADVLDDAYARWQRDPLSVEPSFAAFFEGFELGSIQPAKKNGASPASGSVVDNGLQTRVDGLVYSYRTMGHLNAWTNPLQEAPPEHPLLTLRELGFEEKDLDLVVASKFFLGGQSMKLRDMIAKLKAIYSGEIGFEYMHIQNPRVRNWVRERIEARGAWALDAETQKRMLRHLVKVEAFEQFLHTRFLGVKRFSIEGGEALFSALDGILENCPKFGVEEICMGMAHRGRLAVIVEFLKKPYKSMFKEFDPNYIPDSVFGDGDVKYHLGYVQERIIKPSGAKVGVRLAANPSHLEAVNPVVMGAARARQRILNDGVERSKVVPILIHGDAAFAGQGIVAEVLNMSQLQGYRVGGTVHIVTNNQIGFTTLPADSRSTEYCTDVAKMIEAPIFHVNGDDPAAVRFCAELAFEFRQQFKRDVVVDIVCYRRHGHNETDEPAFTQPDMYREIAAQPTTATIFKDRLVAAGVITEEDAAAIRKEIGDRHEAALEEAKKSAEEKKSGKAKKDAKYAESTAEVQPFYTHDPVKTAVPKERLAEIVKGLTTVPAGFNVLPKLKRGVLDKRATVFAKGEGIDWAFAESLAWGSLLLEGTPVRLSGQDCRRGTFSQRHAVVYDEKTRERYFPLQNLAPDQAKLCIYNSLLSEAAVLGFDYGYSLNYPEMLCQWEAQFGDFVNGAQVIIDQFIASAESKWQRPSGIVLLLPHGYEGQGPEHSSARLERFLQLCAEENIQVANLTTPAQYFHILRRQMKRKFRKPLVLMTPKSMLRLEAAGSKVSDLTEGCFQEILDDPTSEKKAAAERVKRVILCSGKVYYDLVNFRAEQSIGDTAIIRIEQLYPLNEKALAKVCARYSGAVKWVWSQEEPQNMGAWNFIHPRLRAVLDGIDNKHRVLYAGRDEAASTAVGSKGVSDLEQKQFITAAYSV
jgi:2-oxoglutarate dehydrogenase E1 component